MFLTNCKGDRLLRLCPDALRDSKMSLPSYNPVSTSTRSVIKRGKSFRRSKHPGSRIYLQMFFVNWNDDSPNLRDQMEEGRRLRGRNPRVQPAAPHRERVPMALDCHHGPNPSASLARPDTNKGRTLLQMSRSSTTHLRLMITDDPWPSSSRAIRLRPTKA